MTRHKRILIAGVALILGGNAFALIGVAYNRSGEPDAVVELTQRELTVPYAFRGTQEDSGLALRFAWRSDFGAQTSYSGVVYRDGPIAWLDKGKLAELGFDVSVPQDAPNGVGRTRRYDYPLPRAAYVVLEFGGPPYMNALQERAMEVSRVQALLENEPDSKELPRAVEQAQRELDREAHQSSRLFAVDVGPDVAALRNRYPDRAHYLVLPGEVRMSLANRDVTGYITRLTVGPVNVPLVYRAAVMGGSQAKPAHYMVRLAVGKHAEPWILDAQAVAAD